MFPPLLNNNNKKIQLQELRHTEGMQFLVANLVDPVIRQVGGPVAAAVIKCCLPGMGPEVLLNELEGSGGGGSGSGSSGGGGGGGGNGSAAAPSFAADAAAGAAATAAQNEHLAGMAVLTEENLAAAPELVTGAALKRLDDLVKGMNATIGSLPAAEKKYHKAYLLAQKRSIEVIKAAAVLSDRATAAADAAAAAAVAAAADAAAAAATSPEATAAAAASSDAAAPPAAAAAAAAAPTATATAAAPTSTAADASRGQQNTGNGSLAQLLDRCNDDFNRFFQQVDERLLMDLGRSLGNVAGAAMTRIRKGHRALSASLDRHQAKELRDAMMLRSLRRIADAGQGGSAGSGSIGSSTAAALAAVLDGYDRAVKEHHERLAAAQRRTAPPPSAAAAASVAAAAAASASASASGSASFTALYELFFGHW